MIGHETQLALAMIAAIAEEKNKHIDPNMFMLVCEYITKLNAREMLKEMILITNERRN